MYGSVRGALGNSRPYRDRDATIAVCIAEELPCLTRTVRTALLAKPINGINAPQRPDCVAGHVRFEVRRETGKE